MAIMYKGFSSIGKYNKFRITDFELVKRDLLNHFNIKKGEKLMNPNFGTIIWDLIHEPFTEEVKNNIVNDINTIINSDPRVSAEKVTITEYLQGIQIELDLVYVVTNELDTMTMQFDNSSNTMTVA